MQQLKMYTYSQRPELVEAAEAIIGQVWPEFMLNDEVANRYWMRLIQDFGDFQFVLVDEHDHIAAVGNSIPFVWDGEPESLPLRGWDAVFEQGMQDQAAGRTPTTLSALSATVALPFQGQGVSPQVVSAMKKIAAAHELIALVAPVRPSMKSRYPLISMDRYAHWQRADGSPFDPWLRVHRKLGARQHHVAPESMVITGSIAQWEEWTGMPFPASGCHIVPQALEPVEMDVEADLGRYIEPNVWMEHSLAV